MTQHTKVGFVTTTWVVLASTQNDAVFVFFGFFCRAVLCISAAYAVVRCLSVRLSRLCIVSKQVIISVNFFQLLVFTHQTLWQYSDGDPLRGRRGMQALAGGMKNRDFRPISCVIWDLRNDTRYDLSYNGVLRDLSNGVIFNLLLVCVSFTIIGQPWNSVLIRRV